MSTSPWHLDNRRATLRLGPLAACLDLIDPGKGLFDVALADKRHTGVRLLAVSIPPSSAGECHPLMEGHVRGTDLLAAYGASADFPVRVDARWRAVAPASSDRPLAAIELTVSVRTELLDSQPGVVVQSELPRSETLHLVDVDSAKYAPLTIAADSPATLDAGSDTGCFVVRIPETDFSYAEMVHPADFVRAEWTAGDLSATTVRIRQQLFSQSLEKGVILRARLAGALLPRATDTQLAAAYYRQFTAAALPLST